MNKKALLARLNQELMYIRAQARKAEDADRAQNYSGDFELTIDRLEGYGKVQAAEWLLHVVEVYEEGKRIECPNHKGAFDCTPFCELCEGEQEITQ